MAFVTARHGRGEAEVEWLSTARTADTVVLYMAAGQAAEIAAALVDSGRPAGTPAILVENASLADERRIASTLAALGGDATPVRGAPLLPAAERALEEARRYWPL